MIKLSAKYIQGLMNFIMRLSKRERQLMYATVACVLFFGIDRLIVSPVAQKLTDLNQEITDKQTEIRKNLRIVALKDRIIAETMKLAPMLNKIEFDERKVSSLLQEIENYATESSVDLITIKPQGLTARDDWHAYEISLNCEGEMEQLVEFMYKIEHSNNLFLIERFQMTPKRKNSSVVSCSMRVYKVIAQ